MAAQPEGPAQRPAIDRRLHVGGAAPVEAGQGRGQCWVVLLDPVGRTALPKTPPTLVRAIVRDRMRLHLGPIEIGARQNVPASTVHRELTRCGLHRLSHVDRVTGDRCCGHVGLAAVAYAHEQHLRGHAGILSTGVVAG